MRKGVLLFCLFFCAFITQAYSLNIVGIYVADKPLNLETRKLSLQPFANKKEAELYIYQKQNSLSKNYYLIEFQNNANINVTPYSASFGAEYSVTEVLYAAWEKNNSQKNTFFISFEETNNNNSENTFQRGIYSIEKSNNNQCILKLEKLTELINYNQAIPFTSDVAPPLQDNSHSAPIVGNYLASFPIGKNIKSLNLYAINESNKDSSLKKLQKEALSKNEKVAIYNISFFANNNIQVKLINAQNTEQDFQIQIGQWSFIDHENYSISLQISHENSAIFYEYKGDFKLNKNNTNKYTLNLKKQYSIKAQHRLLHYYNNYLKRLENTHYAIDKNHKIIGYYTHHKKLDFSNNYLPMSLEQHDDYEFAKSFLADISKQHGQILHFKKDHTLEIIDFFKNNPYPLPIEAFWYPSIDSNTYIIKYRLEYNDEWHSSLYTFRKEDLSSFSLEKWAHIAKHAILNSN